jgi:hypothetical protein
MLRDSREAADPPQIRTQDGFHPQAKRIRRGEPVLVGRLPKTFVEAVQELLR